MVSRNDLRLLLQTCLFSNRNVSAWPLVGECFRSDERIEGIKAYGEKQRQILVDLILHESWQFTLHYETPY